MADCWHPYTLVATNYPEEGRSIEPKRPMGSHNQLEAKPSPNPQMKKQLTTGRMEK
jgi:hypothetical protein